MKLVKICSIRTARYSTAGNLGRKDSRFLKIRPGAIRTLDSTEVDDSTYINHQLKKKKTQSTKNAAIAQSIFTKKSLEKNCN